MSILVSGGKENEIGDGWEVGAGEEKIMIDLVIRVRERNWGNGDDMLKLDSEEGWGMGER
jgi:hypothetical protein